MPFELSFNLRMFFLYFSSKISKNLNLAVNPIDIIGFIGTGQMGAEPKALNLRMPEKVANFLFYFVRWNTRSMHTCFDLKVKLQRFSTRFNARNDFLNAFPKGKLPNRKLYIVFFTLLNIFATYGTNQQDGKLIVLFA